MEDLKLIMVFVFRANDGCYRDHNNRDQDFISVKLVFYEVLFSEEFSRENRLVLTRFNSMIAAGSTSASIKIQLRNCNPSVAPDCSLYPVARASAAKYDAVWSLR